MSIMDHLHYLRAAMTFKGRVEGTGTCFHRSMALMLDLPPDAELVFGVLRGGTPEEHAANPAVSPVPFIHAWVEFRGDLLAPTTIERTGGELRAMPRDHYYEVNAIKTTWRLSGPAFRQFARHHRLAAAFKHNSQRARAGTTVDALLRAAGVQYKLSSRNTVLPI